MSGPACTACRGVFGSPVSFCPFCGTAQSVRAAVAEPPPAPLPVPPAPSPWTKPPVPPLRPASVPTPVVAAPLVPVAVTPKGFRWRRYLGFVLLGAMLLLALATVLTPAPRGTLLVRVRGPGGAAVTAGQVLIDGLRAGRPGETLDVSAGPHQVGFEEPGYRADPGTVTVQRGGAATLDLVARELPARLSVTTTPGGAAIRLMGRSWGPSPVSLELTPGAYDVAVSLPGYVAKSVSVKLERGEARALSVDLAAVAAPAQRFAPPAFERGIVVAGTPLLATPGGGEVTDTLPPFTEVLVQGQVVGDETWLQVRAGSRKGFVRPDAVEAWDAWAQRNTTSGPIDGMSISMRLVLAGRPYTLSGVQAPERGFSALGLARINASLASLLRGTQARCVPQDAARFVCKTAEGRDIAEMYVLNGAAIASDGAPAYYLEAQRSAREKQKGMWSE